MEPRIAVEGVTFGYPGRPNCLEDVSFDVRRGERIALLGANGSGKSTLLHLLDGLYFPRSGTITALGCVLTEEALEKPPFGPRFRREVAFLFQNSDAQLFCPTVEEELAFGPLQLRLPPDEIRRRISDTLDLLEIAHLRDRAPQMLSGGEQKRVALASLLATGPSILLLDEPTAGLDPRSRFRLIDLLGDLHGAGFTLITATHDLSVVPDLADRALVISEGRRLVADGPVSEVLDDTELLVGANLIHPRQIDPQDATEDTPIEAVVVELHGEVQTLYDLENTIAYYDAFRWEKRVYTPGDCLIHRATGRTAFYTNQRYNQEKIEFVRGGWEHDHCSICMWSLFSSDDPEHGLGFTNESEWLCTECYWRFLAPLQNRRSP